MLSYQHANKVVFTTFCASYHHNHDVSWKLNTMCLISTQLIICLFNEKGKPGKPVIKKSVRYVLVKE